MPRVIVYTPFDGKAWYEEISGWEEISTLLKCPYITGVPLGEGLTMWVDDEGLLLDPNPRGYFRLPSYTQPFAGNAVFAASDGKGNVVDIPDWPSLQLIMTACVPYTPDTAELEAARTITITSWDDSGDKTVTTISPKEGS